MNSTSNKHVFYGQIESKEFVAWIQTLIKKYGQHKVLRFVAEDKDTKIKDETIDFKITEQMKFEFEKDE
jgi:hypothetical protein